MRFSTMPACKRGWYRSAFCVCALAFFIACVTLPVIAEDADPSRNETVVSVDISGDPTVVVNGHALDHEHDHPHAHDHLVKPTIEKSPTILSVKEKYIYSLSAILIISVTSLVGVTIIPITRKYPGFAQHMMTFLVALSIGSLVGDATMHLIPESFVPHSHDSDHAHCHGAHGCHQTTPEGIEGDEHQRNFLISLFIVIGIYTFFLFEKLLQRFHHGHGHSHSHSTPIDTEKAKNGHIRPIGWLILFGEVLHNLSDGLAIGAAFSESFGSGMSTALAVLWHEVPHELGDYVVLVNAGFTPLRALTFNFLANISAFLGCVIAVALTSMSSHSAIIKACIMGFTAGSFLYVALADLIPELQHEHEDGSGDDCPLQMATTTIENDAHPASSSSSAMLQDKKVVFVKQDLKAMERAQARKKNIRWFCQQGGMLTGFAILAIVAYYEESLNNLISH